MCPACFASAALLIGSIISTGGLTALVARTLRTRSSAKTMETLPVETTQQHFANEEEGVQ